jgi:hypothetical protein
MSEQGATETNQRVKAGQGKLFYGMARASGYNFHSSNWLELVVGGLLNSDYVSSSCKGTFSKG